METLQAFLTEQNKKTFLDIGTGVGNFIQFISRLYPNFESFIGIDSLDKMIDIATKQSTNEKVHFERMDGYHMTFEDNSFDIVCLSNSLHHLSDIPTMLDEMARVTKPDGFILINEMISDKLNNMQVSHKLMHHFAAAIDRELGDIHYDTFTHQELIDMLSNHPAVTLEKQWLLHVPQKNENSPEEIDYIMSILDRVSSRIPNDNTKLLAQKEQIQSYIIDNGYDGCPSFIGILNKTPTE